MKRIILTVLAMAMVLSNLTVLMTSCETNGGGTFDAVGGDLENETGSEEDKALTFEEIVALYRSAYEKSTSEKSYASKRTFYRKDSVDGEWTENVEYKVLVDSNGTFIERGDTDQPNRSTSYYSYGKDSYYCMLGQVEKSSSESAGTVKNASDLKYGNYFDMYINAIPEAEKDVSLICEKKDGNTYITVSLKSMEAFGAYHRFSTEDIASAKDRGAKFTQDIKYTVNAEGYIIAVEQTELFETLTGETRNDFKFEFSSYGKLGSIEKPEWFK